MFEKFFGGEAKDPNQKRKDEINEQLAVLRSNQDNILSFLKTNPHPDDRQRLDVVSDNIKTLEDELAGL